ncbi:LysR family transcriptional regulator [Nocardioides panacis]|uniref:LysR family transcriptional regulator n=1 Tax=Nocardioides panacis TaxID=2849501 RepID=A0A975XZC1_9ACTN|nr:LysR family transcriptional regulator [Nocardioides panacis]QWZ07282.1 LysR family transcriptional regulator [Nocardioides panacis]
MEPRRLELLLELSRLGSMRAVADVLSVTTSTVSQQIAALAREVGTPLVEPEGRRVRLTPAGRRLADHAVTILAAIEAARLDLDPSAVPAGTVRVAAFATAVRATLMPVVHTLAAEHPDVHLQILEHEPDECLELLAADDIDLALTYEFALAPAGFDATLETVPLWEADWGLGVPAGDPPAPGTSVDVLARYRDSDWIVNSRNNSDLEAVARVASQAGFVPRVVHRADSLELVEDLIVAGLGVGLLPQARAVVDGVRVLALAEPRVTLRAHAVVRRGRTAWPPLALVLRLLT